MIELWLAFEGGGTRTRALLAKQDGEIIAREKGGPSSPLYIEPESYGRTTREMLKRLKDRADKFEGRVTMGCLSGPMNPALVSRLIRDVFNNVVLFSISEADLALALYNLRSGVALVAGTGSCCRVLTTKGSIRFCGGLGPQFGDEGSAYWIGREGMAAALRAAEGRGPRTALTSRLFRYWNIRSGHEIVSRYGPDGFLFPPRVAGFAREVFEAAKDGDRAALRVCREAGRALGRLAVETVRGSGFRARPIPLVVTGGVFYAGGLITTPLKQVLRSSGLAFQVYPPAPEPVEGMLNAIRRRKKGEKIGVP